MTVASIVALILACVSAGFSVMAIRDARRARQYADRARAHRERAERALRGMRRDEPALPNWRHGPGVLVDDDGHRLNPSVFGLVLGEKLRLSYVLAHPELPWPQYIRGQSERQRSRADTSVQEWTE